MSCRQVSIKNVAIKGGFWGKRLKINREVTLQIEHEQCKKTGRIDAFRLKWKPEDPIKPHVFWDSDVAKWIEAAAYSLATDPDPELEKKVDDVILLISKAQQPDGYLNSYFTSVEPGKRWTNIRDLHELYCAGHLMEAAVAYFDATGKRLLLDTLCKYADYIAKVFGPAPGQIHGYCGHEEIELALVRLFHATGNNKYLELSKYFIDQRGKQPNFFDEEKKKRNMPLPNDIFTSDYYQADVPVREQKTAYGHAVRACYLYSGMADIAGETGDRELLQACRTLWNNITEKRMYIHGGIGSAQSGECFTFDYDLPNESAYAETCAAISFVFFSHRLLQTEQDSRYADAIEKALYNGIISGVSLDGTRFFYANYLASFPGSHSFNKQLSPARQEWFGCACCPPNLARLLASLGQYVYSQENDKILVHQYISGKAVFDIDGHTFAIDQKTEYPWEENVELAVKTKSPLKFTMALRIPGWCEKASVRINSRTFKLDGSVKKGYVYIDRTWKSGDQVELHLPMPVLRMKSHPHVRQNAGRVAIQRGPIIYCLEEIDNGSHLNDIQLPADSKLSVEKGKGIFRNIPLVKGKAFRSNIGEWNGKLYRKSETKNPVRPVGITAVPYFMWANRGIGEMTIWIREA